MKAVTYITENTIMKFLYNPKKTFLEGFVKEWLRFDSGTYQDYGKNVRCWQKRKMQQVFG